MVHAAPMPFVARPSGRGPDSTIGIGTRRRRGGDAAGSVEVAAIHLPRDGPGRRNTGIAIDPAVEGWASRPHWTSSVMMVAAPCLFANGPSVPPIVVPSVAIVELVFAERRPSGRNQNRRCRCFRRTTEQVKHEGQHQQGDTGCYYPDIALEARLHRDKLEIPRPRAGVDVRDVLSVGAASLAQIRHNRRVVTTTAASRCYAIRRTGIASALAHSLHGIAEAVAMLVQKSPPVA